MMAGTSIPKFFQRARALAEAAPVRTSASFLARAERDVGELYVYDAIGTDPWTGGGVTAKDIAKALDGMKGAREIRLYVNSPGGSITEAFAMVAQLERHPARKVAYVDGIAASAASFVAATAKRVVMAKGATQMIHEAWAPAVGSADDLRAAADALEKFTQLIADVYARKTGRPLAEIRALMAAETWMTAAEAMALGFADEIAQDDPQPVRASASGPAVLAYASKLAAAGRMAATLRRASAAKGQ